MRLAGEKNVTGLPGHMTHNLTLTLKSTKTSRHDGFHNGGTPKSQILIGFSLT